MLRLLCEDREVCLDRTSSPEFDHWRWVDYWKPVDDIVFFKRKVYKKALEELEPLLPAIHEAIIKPAPSGIMFAHEIRMNGLELFAKHRVSERIELLASYARHQKPHASEKRIATIMEMLKSYGAHARRAIPLLLSG